MRVLVLASPLLVGAAALWWSQPCASPLPPCPAELEVGLARARPWGLAPDVLVCEGAPVSVEQVQRELDTWSEHGAPRLRAMPDPCHVRGPTGGVVRIDRADPDDPVWQDERLLGYTRLDRERAETGRPHVWARIELEGPSEAVLRHELGHLWFDHADAADHVMYPYMTEQESWEGVRTAFARTGQQALADPSGEASFAACEPSTDLDPSVERLLGYLERRRPLPTPGELAPLGE